MIELGDTIILDGFDNIEPIQLIVIKKVVGSFAKNLTEKKGEFDKLEIKKIDNKILVKITKGDDSFEAEAGESNLFCSLSKALDEANQNYTF